MPIFRLFLFAALFTVFAASHAQAQRRSGVWKWVEADQFNIEDFKKPYLKDGVNPHAHLWDNEDWSPQEWIITAGGAEYVMKDLYKAGVISDQTISNGIPVLEVGHTFMALSSSDQEKILSFLDYLYEITAREQYGMIKIEDEETNIEIGFYTATGLHLQ